MVDDDRPQIWQASFEEEVSHWFDDSSRSGESPGGSGDGPKFVLVYGTPVSGKTRFRRERYTSGYVTVDAGDIFRRLGQGRLLDFPGELEPFLELIGRAVAERAIRERRHIVTEAFGVDPEALQALVVRMKDIGYETHVDFIKTSVERAEEWNFARGEDNVSSYYTDAFNLTWLMEGAKAAEPE